MGGFMLTGPIQTRVFDFMRIRSAIELEMKGLRLSQGSALKAAIAKGYVPQQEVRRGAIDRRREVAFAYMSYVATLLLSGAESIARSYGEEIVTGKLIFEKRDECGCPVFRGGEGSYFLTELELATMCVGHETHTPTGNELALSDCDHGCKIYKCVDCGERHVFHNSTYGCRKG